MADAADRVAGHDRTLPGGLVPTPLNEDNGDDEVSVTLQAGQPGVTGGLPFAVGGMCVQTLADPVR